MIPTIRIEVLECDHPVQNSIKQKRVIPALWWAEYASNPKWVKLADVSIFNIKTLIKAKLKQKYWPIRMFIHDDLHDAIMRQLETIPEGKYQHYNMFTVEMSLRDDKDYRGAYRRLASLAKKGIISQGNWKSIWASMNDTPTYGPSKRLIPESRVNNEINKSQGSSFDLENLRKRLQ